MNILLKKILNAINEGLEQSLYELSNATLLSAADKIKYKTSNIKKWVEQQPDSFKNRIRKMTPDLLTHYLVRQTHVIITNANSINPLKNVLHYLGYPVSPEFCDEGETEYKVKLNNQKKYNSRKPTEYEHLIYLAVNDYDKCTLPNKQEIKDEIEEAFIDYLTGNAAKYDK